MTPAKKTTASKDLNPAEDTRKAFGLARCKGGWCAITIMYKYPSMEVVDISETIPDIKAEAIEKFKIGAAKAWRETEDGI